MPRAARIINATAPVRVCDLGGWTDTWFAEHGAVLNIGVYPYAEAQILVSAPKVGDEAQITINVENFGDRYVLTSRQPEYDRHPLLEACIDIMDLPEDLSFELNLFSNAPAGCSTGTSAAVSVALLGALDLLTPGRRTAHEVAELAHRVESEKLGLQSGIQDQLCAAYGGICFMEMQHYPHARVSPVHLPNATWWELERRLLLVYLGRTHSSSDVHKEVIAGLEEDASAREALKPLRKAAYAGKAALYDGDFESFGAAMRSNTEAQAALHPKLVSDDAKAVIALAREFGCLGWKVNGAGGEGGSLTVLCGPEEARKHAFVDALEGLNAGYKVIPTYLSRMGLRCWETRPR